MQTTNRRATAWLAALVILAGVIAFIPEDAQAATLDIQSYGARCNGTDDASAVQSAINALSSGDTLNVTCMASIGSAGINVTGKSNITIQGQNGGGFRAIGVTSQKPDFGPALLYVNGGSGITIQNLDINSNNLPVISLLMFQTSNSFVRNNRLHDVAWEATGGALGAQYNTNNVYDGNIVYNTGSPDLTTNGIRGIWVRDTNPTITRNEIYKAGGSALVCDCAEGEISYNNSHDNQVSGYKIQGSNRTTGVIKFHHNKSTNTYQDLTIDSFASLVEINNNEFSGSRGDGIYSNSAFGAKLVINDNYFHDSQGTAIKLFTAASADIKNNRLHRNSIAIQLQSRGSSNPTNVSITNNDIRGNYRGIFFGNNEYNNGGTVGSVTASGNAIAQSTEGGWLIESDVGGSISQTSNCYVSNPSFNISDGRGVLSNPGSSSSCTDPTSIPAGDTTPPSVGITTPTSGSTLSGTVTISASASDNVGVAGVQFKVDGQNIGSEDTSAPYSVSWNASSVSAGSHTLTAIARDLAGNVNTSSVVVNVASTPAPTPVSCPAAGTNAFTGCYYNGMNFETLVTSRTDNTINFNWPGSPVTGVNADQFSVRWKGNFNFSAGTYDFTATTDDGIRIYVDNELVVNGWLDQPPTTYTGTKTLTSGTHLVTVEFYENGYGAEANVSWLLKSVPNIDTIPPIVTITSPLNASRVSGIYTVTANATDNVGVAGVQFKVNGDPFPLEDTVAPYTFSWITTNFGEMNHTLSATARDAAGNLGNSTVVTVTVDNVPDPAPIPPSTKFSVGQRVQATPGVGANLNVRSTASASGTLLGTQANGALGTVVSGGTSADGYYWWNVNFDSGVDGYAVESFLSAYTAPTPVIDTTPPTATMTNPTNGSTISGVVTATASAFDNVGVAGVQFLVNDSVYGPEDTTAPYSVNWVTTDFGNMNHTIAARVRDAAGNTGQSTPVSVTVNNGTISGKFTAGQRVEVTVGAGSSLNVRSNSTVYSTLLGTQPNGALGTVVSGGMSADGYIWWNVNFDSGVDGYVVENYISAYTAPAQDTTPPSVNITYPAANTTVSGVTTITANATDNVGVAGVQFKINGDSFPAEDTTPPYTYDWVTTDFGNMSHTISATARDTAGNTSYSGAVTVTVNNGSTPPPPPPPPTPTVKFNIGDRVQTTESVRVRAAPNGSIIGKQNRGIKGTVLNGGQTVGGYTWWNVNFDSGKDGYVAEPYLSLLTTAFAPSSNLAAVAASTSSPTSLQAQIDALQKIVQELLLKLQQATQ